jgi:hypothetical protein
MRFHSQCELGGGLPACGTEDEENDDDCGCGEKAENGQVVFSPLYLVIGFDVTTGREFF